MTFRSRIGSGILAAFAILLGIAMPVIALEAWLRLSQTRVTPRGFEGWIRQDPELLLDYTSEGRRLIPGTRAVIRNHRLSHRNIEMNVNALGFRDRELPAAKEPGETRVLVLGDSITVGDYLQADEVYVERAQQALAKRRVEFVNAGVGDIGLREEVAILRERGLAVSPDVVLVAFYLNDSRPPWGFANEVGSRGWLRRHSMLAEVVYRGIRLRQWVTEGGEDRFSWIQAEGRLDWRHDRDDFLALARLARVDWGAAWEESSWDDVESLLSELGSLSARHGFRVGVVAFPVRFQVESTLLEASPQERLRGIAAASGFEFLDLLPELRSRFAASGESAFFDHCHPTVEANRWIGQALARWFEGTFL